MNLEVYNSFRSVPQEAKKEIAAGRLKGFTDINPMWRIKMLTEKFGVCGFGWYYEVIEQKLENGSDGQKSAFVTIHLFVKIEGEWSKPIVGLGGSSFITNEKNGAYTSDECFKMAFTDALSIACKSLGMGADVYFAKDRTKYDQENNQQNQVTQNQTPKNVDDKTIEDAVELMNNVTSYIQMVKVWDSYPEYKDKTEFKNACTNAGRKYPK